MNKKYLIFFICTIIFITIISISIAVLSNSNKDNKNEKVEQEIEFIEEKLIGMINSLNNISFSNSVLLEQNTIKGQENSSKNQSNQEDSGSSSNGSGENENSQSNSKSEETSDSSSSSSQSERGTDYSKYNVENKNILIESQDKIDWNYLKNNVEIINSSWPTIMIDLHSIDVKNDGILLFSNTLDSLIISLEKEDKKETLNNLAVLYGLIPTYIEQFTDDIEKINISYTKSCIINAYVLLEDNRWDDMQNEIIKASNFFNKIIDSISVEKQKSTISKIYILLNEMNNSIKTKDKKLFYLKYINLMENATII